MAEFPIPDDAAFVTFFDGSVLPDGTAYGLHRVKCHGERGDGFWGAQAIVFPRRTVEYLAAFDLEKVAPGWSSGKFKHACDSLMGMALDYSPWPRYMVHVPSLVEHVGVVSAAGTDVLRPDRVARNFAGMDFDATTLGDFKPAPVEVRIPIFSETTVLEGEPTIPKKKYSLKPGIR